MVMDVKRAFLHAFMQRKVYINLPEEATCGGNDDMVGLLKRGHVWDTGCAAVLAGAREGSDGEARFRGREGQPVHLPASGERHRDIRPR